jgi:hypothetical protein
MVPAFNAETTTQMTVKSNQSFFHSGIITTLTPN